MGMTHNQLMLIKAIAENRISDIKKAAIVCCEEDKTQKNRYYTERYKTMLEINESTMLELPDNIKRLVILEDVSSSFNESRYFLPDKEKELFEYILKMNVVSGKLMEIGIQYLNSVLIYGKPGTGKTMFGRYVAYKMKLPFMYLNFSRIIDSYLGGTSKNLGQIFDYARLNKCILMLDEMDCIGINRNNDKGGVSGEMARVTITLMQEMDRISNGHIIIAATNRLDMVDAALMRRFTKKQEFTYLSAKDNFSMIERFLENVGYNYDIENVHSYAEGRRSQHEIVNHIIHCLSESIMRDEKMVAL